MPKLGTWKNSSSYGPLVVLPIVNGLLSAVCIDWKVLPFHSLWIGDILSPSVRISSLEFLIQCGQFILDTLEWKACSGTCCQAQFENSLSLNQPPFYCCIGVQKKSVNSSHGKFFFDFWNYKGYIYGQVLVKIGHLLRDGSGLDQMHALMHCWFVVLLHHWRFQMLLGWLLAFLAWEFLRGRR